MEKEMTETGGLRQQWNSVCNAYLKAFIDKHKLSKEVYPWVGDNPGTIATIGDYYINMDVIRYDVDNDINVGRFEEWYSKNVDYGFLGLKYMNYETYCHGCPDPYTDEQIKSIIDSKRKIAETKAELKRLIEEAEESRDTKVNNFSF